MKNLTFEHPHEYENYRRSSGGVSCPALCRWRCWRRRRGLLGVDQQPRFRAYVKQEHRTSYTYDRPVVVGAEPPGEGVTYYAVPSEYGVQNFRYAVVNDETALVDPTTHHIVEVIQ